MSLQIDLKKKIIKGKKPSYKLLQFPQNTKKSITTNNEQSPLYNQINFYKLLILKYLI